MHRDIKPDNVLIDEDGHISLADFGIARDFHGGEAGAQPWGRVQPWGQEGDIGADAAAAGKGTRKRAGDETHSLVGTPGYTAPEVYSGTYSYGADVWGVGVILYGMIVGKVRYVANLVASCLLIVSWPLKLPFGLKPNEQGLEELISRTDSYAADFELPEFVHPDLRDLLTKVCGYARPFEG